jgi:hydrogenase maturation protease
MNTLVAGLGNIFLADDAFGVAVAHRLAQTVRTDGVRVVDFGVRGVHLAFELLEPPDMLIVIDAVSRGADPGTLFVLDPESWERTRPSRALPTRPDAHGLEFDAVLRLLRAFGRKPPPTRIVGCEPARLEEHIGLSEPVRNAIDPAIALVEKIIAAPQEVPIGGQHV